MRNLITYITKSKLTILVIVSLVSNLAKSQDKLFFRNGNIVTCKIVAISEKTITYKDTTAYAIGKTVLKSEIIIAEYQNGTIYIFEQADSQENSNDPLAKKKYNDVSQKSNLTNVIGIHPVDIFFGRFTLSYEKLLANNTIGILIPVSTTFNLYNTARRGSSNNQRNNDVGLITGIDVNYYFDIKNNVTYFFGPRFRYGTDIILGGIEGTSFQLQNGISNDFGKKLTHSIGFGVGFIKPSARYSTLPGFEPNQVYPWFSFNWRLGLRL